MSEPLLKLKLEALKEIQLDLIRKKVEADRQLKKVERAIIDLNEEMRDNMKEETSTTPLWHSLELSEKLLKEHVKDIQDPEAQKALGELQEAMATIFNEGLTHEDS